LNKAREYLKALEETVEPYRAKLAEEIEKGAAIEAAPVTPARRREEAEEAVAEGAAGEEAEAVGETTVEEEGERG
jgi:hypothetical protein